MNSPQNLLKLAESYLKELVTPQANTIDNDNKALQNTLFGLVKLGLLALKVRSSNSHEDFGSVIDLLLVSKSVSQTPTICRISVDTKWF